MKKLAAITTVFCGFALGAAAEPAPRPPLWTGFYAGLNAGYAWNAESGVNLTSTPTFLADPPVRGPRGEITSRVFWASANHFLTPNDGGFIGGGQFGYNRQIGERLVAGVEADIQGVASAGAATTATKIVPLPVPPYDPGNFVMTSLSASKRLDYLGTLRGRLGFLVTPTLLAYGSAGLAYGGVSSNAATLQLRNGPVLPFGVSNTFSDTLVGWTAGGGVEWMFAPGWSAKAEYLYYDLGNASYDLGTLAAVVLPPIAPVPTLGSASFSRAHTRFDGHVVRLGVNYHFDWSPFFIAAQ